MKKRVLAVLLAAVLLLPVLAACQSDPAPAAPAPAPAAEAPAAEAPAAEAPAAEAPAAAPGAAVDYSNLRNFVINPADIPQEKLDTELYLAVSIRGVENPYLATIYDGMMLFSEYLDSIGQKHNTRLLDSGGDNDAEVTNMRNFAAMADGNAIAYSDPNEDAIAYSLAEAMAESGGFIGTAWNKPDDVGPLDLTPNWVIHTSPDNVQSGYDIAVLLFESMGGSGKVFVVEGMLGNTAAMDRAAGLERALAEFPDIEVAERDTGNWATSEALDLVQTWLTIHPDVGGIWCANDNMVLGAIQALDGAGLKGEVGVVGIDAIPDVIQDIIDGYALATVSSNGFLQGGFTLAITYAVWAGLLDVSQFPPDFREFATPSVLVTSTNAQQVRDEMPVFDFSRPFAGAMA